MATEICSSCDRPQTAGNELCTVPKRTREGVYLVRLCRGCFLVREVRAGLREDSVDLSTRSTVLDGLETLYTLLHSARGEAYGRNGAQGEGEGQGSRETTTETPGTSAESWRSRSRSPDPLLGSGRS